MSILFIAATMLFSCQDNYFDTKNDPVTYGETNITLDFATDKAAYKPNEQVWFTLKSVPAGAKVRYSHLGKTIEEQSVITPSWSWTPPATDFKGYMATVYTTENGVEKICATIAVDVSSDWAKFPRYGFLSIYDQMQEQFVERNIERLNRYHINGLQFYDWLYDHQRPFAGTVENPAPSWPDIFNRPNYLSTVQSYIAAAKKHDIKTMFYNLCYGATKNAASDGVSEEWYIFKDKNHAEKDYHDLSGGRSHIWLVDAGNADWQRYIAERNNDIYALFDFDGYHIDQLGYRGSERYDYNGNAIDFSASYASFIRAMKSASPGKRLLFNAVGGYTQDGIANEAVDFLYAEIWGARSGDNPEMTYNDLVMQMRNNVQQSNPEKNIVLAAYMDYDSKSVGFVNKAGVLLVNSAIFAWGGSHLELGEHYLINEYFPSNNLQMREDLAQGLIGQYDFLVAYQNLLRDGGEFQAADVTFADASIVSERWDANNQGKIAAIGKRVAGKDVVHLINFRDASSMVWRDPKGTQTEPQLIENKEIGIEVSGTVSKVWFASPDIDGGVSRTLDFVQNGNQISVTLPSLKYWDMIVIEY
ncbi:MAG: glycoside hydrolase family 66 protein [Dysgonamonadaceae bacterium]|nr:glycoside hydrolase family 66 protein [Dysgonamonadaceae bacterium]